MNARAPHPPSEPLVERAPFIESESNANKEQHQMEAAVIEMMEDPASLEPVQRLTRDIAKAGYQLSDKEARFLVDAYYSMQKRRIRDQNQIRSMQGEDEEPHEVLQWLQSQDETLEKQIQRALDKYSMSKTVGEWSRSICGVGPVIAAGLLAHIDITQAPTVGHIWRFAGLDPTVTWEKGEKRPWNTPLKTLCWKLGESFIKVSGNDNDYYGKVYRARKQQEVQKNAAGDFAEQATNRAKSIGKSTDSWAWYNGCYPGEIWNGYLELDTATRAKMHERMKGEAGSGVAMLPPAHINARARRYAVKLFLAHWHHVAYESHFNEKPPKPYIIEHGGHVHYIGPPNWK